MLSVHDELFRLAVRFMEMGEKILKMPSVAHRQIAGRELKQSREPKLRGGGRGSRSPFTRSARRKEAKKEASREKRRRRGRGRRRQSKKRSETALRARQ